MDRQRAVVVGRTGGWGMALLIRGAPVLADSRRNWLHLGWFINRFGCEAKETKDWMAYQNTETVSSLTQQ